MEHKERDNVIRKKILNEILDIESFINGFNMETFTGSRLAQTAVVMSLINIGELSKSFSNNYIEKTQEIPWKAIRGLRNIAAHQYESIRIENVWLTIKDDIPVLKRTLLDNE